LGSGDDLQRGLKLENEGDLSGAEIAYSRADEQGNAEGALLLGVLLKRRGDLDGAEAAYRRADARGNLRGTCNLGLLLQQRGQLAEAKIVLERAAAGGDAFGAVNLATLLHAEGDLAGALVAISRADELGDAEGSRNLAVLLMQAGDFAGAEAAARRAVDRGNLDSLDLLGRLLEQRGDITGATDAFARADELGDANGAFSLSGLLLNRGDTPGAIAALHRAAARGHDGAPVMIQVLEAENDMGAQDRGVESAPDCARRYAAACAEVKNSAVPVIEVAQRAVNAHDLSHQGHEISRERFRRLAAQEEAAFVPLYQAFEEACAVARDAAATFRVAAGSEDVELILLETLDDDTYSMTETAGHLLRGRYGPTASQFWDGMEVASAAMNADVYYFGDDGFIGHVHSPQESED
jgi:Tetratricopeptide repeat.